jgi:hypothetical protein
MRDRSGNWIREGLAPGERERIDGLPIWAWYIDRPSKWNHGLHLVCRPEARERVAAQFEPDNATALLGREVLISLAAPFAPRFFPDEPTHRDMRRLVLAFHPASLELGQYCASVVGDIARLDIAPAGLLDLRWAFRQLKRDTEFGISPRPLDDRKESLPFGERDAASLPLMFWQ